VVFLGVTATPPVFTDFLSPILSDSYRLRLIRTVLKLSGIKRNRKGQGCLGGYKKHPTLLSICFQFAFNRTDSKRDREIQREQFYA
jgi:hypothetical protein